MRFFLHEGWCRAQKTSGEENPFVGLVRSAPAHRPPRKKPLGAGATGPVANRRNRLKASAGSAGPKTATSPPPNPGHDATLAKVAGRCEARTVGSDQRRLAGLSLWSENGSRLAASSRPQ